MNDSDIEQYQPHKIESEVQKFWEVHRCFNVKPDLSREKFYCLSMFPYPSGKLHMGHVRNYTIGDAISRYQRMLGKRVLQPMGWDAFGLPAENAAIKSGISPSKWTKENIATMRQQMKCMGFAYDWEREIETCHPDYYRWEQWFFNQLYKKGLAYRKEAWVNWDPVDQTVLANEQVIDGKGWRSGAFVERKCVQQWFLRITDYAEELLQGLEKLDVWPKQVRTMQKNWIGRSQGLEINFMVEGHDEPLTVFTTRPDTLMGVSFLALAPEHPLVNKLSATMPELQSFVETCAQRSTAEATMATLKKEGMGLGLQCVHPLTGETIPIWCVNFILMEYGTGAVMSVPAHDVRDWEFAREKDLPIRQVIAPLDSTQTVDLSIEAFVEKGVLCHSGKYDGMDYNRAYDAIADDLEAKEAGKRVINYRLRDWGVSRQRYWGCPIPMVWEDDTPHPVADETLPVILPEIDSCETAIPTLTSVPEFIHVGHTENQVEIRRDTDTFDTFVESSWYYARFASPHTHDAMLGEEAKYWLPVDQYIGGIEHAVLHLLYARFFYKLMRDIGLVEGDEPFTNLLTQGMVLKDGVKMSKSRGNTVDPEVLVRRYGADTVRLFILFAAPPEYALEWSDDGVSGAFRFLKRLWKHVIKHSNTDGNFSSKEISVSDKEQCRTMRRIIHETIAKVTEDIHKHYRFNTAIAANMKLLNELQRFEKEVDSCHAGYKLIREGLEAMLKMLAPMVPHITHHLWQKLGHNETLVDCRWPEVDQDALAKEVCTVMVQVDGKLRGKLTLPLNSSQAAAQEAVNQHSNIQKFLQDKTIRKVIWLPDKLVNFVLGGEKG